MQLLGELAHALFVGAADDERAACRPSMQLLEHDDLTRDVGAAGEHDVERLVEHDFLAALRCSSSSSSGCTDTRILRPAVKMSTVPSSFVPR